MTINFVSTFLNLATILPEKESLFKTDENQVIENEATRTKEHSALIEEVEYAWSEGRNHETMMWRSLF